MVKVSSAKLLVFPSSAINHIRLSNAVSLFCLTVKVELPRSSLLAKYAGFSSGGRAVGWGVLRPELILQNKVHDSCIDHAAIYPAISDASLNMEDSDHCSNFTEYEAAQLVFYIHGITLILSQFNALTKIYHLLRESTCISWNLMFAGTTRRFLKHVTARVWSTLVIITAAAITPVNTAIASTTNALCPRMRSGRGRYCQVHRNRDFPPPLFFCFIWHIFHPLDWLSPSDLLDQEHAHWPPPSPRKWGWSRHCQRHPCCSDRHVALLHPQWCCVGWG